MKIIGILQRTGIPISIWRLTILTSHYQFLHKNMLFNRVQMSLSRTRFGKKNYNTKETGSNSYRKTERPTSRQNERPIDQMPDVQTDWLKDRPRDRQWRDSICTILLFRRDTPIIRFLKRKIRIQIDLTSNSMTEMSESLQSSTNMIQVHSSSLLSTVSVCWTSLYSLHH